MRTEGQEIHEETDAARAGSTPNIVRWVLAISLLAAVVLLSLVWITGAATTSGADETNNATDRIRAEADQRPNDNTDSIVSDDPAFKMEPAGSDAASNPMNKAVEPSPAQTSAEGAATQK